MNSWLALRAAVTGCVSVGVLLAPVVSFAAQTAQEERAKKEAEIPTCTKKYGALAVVEPERQWWVEYGLGSPEALLKVFVSKSGCFTLVDRGKGMAAAKAERELASSGELRGRSNVGKGQVKAADYVLVPDLISQNKNAGGNKVGGMLGGLLPGAAGAVLGGVSLKKKTADVVLTVTDVRSSEQVALSEGHSTKTDLGWGAGGGLFTGGGFAAGGATGYADTEIGQVVTLAYLQAYTDLIKKFSELPDNASAANAQQSVTMAKPGRMYVSASPSSKVVRTLDPGMMLYPTGEKQDVMWEVEDELGNKGWVSSILFQLAR
ncbi:MAG TPA: CsgG/HfaB family protein [Steroidobacteraceae bacterium]|nr:CsgG/HfaB family protein [Steroidobacteraceae bacterium]